MKTAQLSAGEIDVMASREGLIIAGTLVTWEDIDKAREIVQAEVFAIEVIGSVP